MLGDMLKFVSVSVVVCVKGGGCARLLGLCKNHEKNFKQALNKMYL